jgi:hypothetical protein
MEFQQHFVPTLSQTSMCGAERVQSLRLIGAGSGERLIRHRTSADICFFGAEY